MSDTDTRTTEEMLADHRAYHLEALEAWQDEASQLGGITIHGSRMNGDWPVSELDYDKVVELLLEFGVWNKTQIHRHLRKDIRSFLTAIKKYEDVENKPLRKYLAQFIEPDDGGSTANESQFEDAVDEVLEHLAVIAPENGLSRDNPGEAKRCLIGQLGNDRQTLEVIREAVARWERGWS